MGLWSVFSVQMGARDRYNPANLGLGKKAIAVSCDRGSIVEARTPRFDLGGLADLSEFPVRPGGTVLSPSPRGRGLG